MPSCSSDPQAIKIQIHVLSITANSDNTLIAKYHPQDQILSPGVENLRCPDARGRVAEENMTGTPTVKKAVPTTPVNLCGHSPLSPPRLSHSLTTNAASLQVFHEGLKSWSCCNIVNKPVLEFDQFMQIPVSDHISSTHKTFQLRSRPVGLHDWDASRARPSKSSAKSHIERCKFDADLICGRQRELFDQIFRAIIKPGQPHDHTQTRACGD